MKSEIVDVCTTVVEEFNFEDHWLLGSDASSLIDKYLHVRGMCSLHLQNRTVKHSKLVLTEGRKARTGDVCGTIMCLGNIYQ